MRRNSLTRGASIALGLSVVRRRIVLVGIGGGNDPFRVGIESVTQRLKKEGLVGVIERLMVGHDFAGQREP